MKKKNISIKDIILVFLPVILIYSIIIIINIVDVIVLSLNRILGDYTSSPNESVGSIISDAYNKPWNNAIVTFLVYVTFCIVFSIWYKKKIIGSYDFKKNIYYFFKSYLWIFIIILGIACQFTVSNLIIAITPSFKSTMKEYSNLMDNSIGASVPWLLMVTIFFIAPIAEEIIFRGLILKYSTKIMPVIASIVLQAVFFSLYHSNIVQQIYAFVFGLLLGYIAYSMNSILPSILLHISINLSTLILPTLNKSDTKNATSLLIVSGAALIAFLVIIISLNKHMLSRQDPQDS